MEEVRHDASELVGPQTQRDTVGMSRGLEVRGFVCKAVKGGIFATLGEKLQRLTGRRTDGGGAR